MAFNVPEDDLAKARFDVPNKIVKHLSIKGKSVIDIGCGDMMVDFALLNHGAQSISGLDVVAAQPAHIGSMAKYLSIRGFDFPSDYAERLSFTSYDGENIPFPDKTFDVAISWGVIEHVQNVERFFQETKRVMVDDGVAFISVFPWWHCYHGSHLSDYIDEPFFHLKRDTQWVRSKLDEYAASNGSELLMDHMFREYTTLNKISVDRVFEIIQATGLRVSYCEVTSYAADLSEAPLDVSLTDLMTS